jgi:hypothetical protein
MKGIKRVDKPLPGLEVKTDVVFSEISEQFECQLRASEFLTASFFLKKQKSVN